MGLNLYFLSFLSVVKNLTLKKSNFGLKSIVAKFMYNNLIV